MKNDPGFATDRTPITFPRGESEMKLINYSLKRPVIQISILLILILWTAAVAGFLVFDEADNIFHINLLKKSISNLPRATGQIYADIDMDKRGSFNVAPRKIDGVLVPEEEANLYPVAIMIENMIDSRPSSGLAKANLVYEVVAEAGITRFLAIYTDRKSVV